MDRETVTALVELAAVSEATEGHGIDIIEPIGLMPKAGISED